MNRFAVDIPVFYKPLEAAKRLNISRAGIYRLLKSGRIRSVKLGGSRLIADNDLYDFIQDLYEDND